MPRPALFALVTAAVFAAGAYIAIRAIPSLGLDGQRAVVMSAGIAFTVQMLTFGVALFFGPDNMMAGRGMGMLLRFFTVVLHGFLGSRLLGLPMGAALVSLAAFFFAGTIIEPFFLTRPDPPASPTK